MKLTHENIVKDSHHCIEKSKNAYKDKPIRRRAKIVMKSLLFIQS